MVIATPIRDRVDEGTVVVQGTEEEITKMDLHLGDDKRRLESRCVNTGLVFFDYSVLVS